jgi:hypothetical protein
LPGECKNVENMKLAISNIAKLSNLAALLSFRLDDLRVESN